MSSPAAKFFVNQGVVSSRSDMLHLLRPLLKQTVTYRYLRGREVVSHGTGWVERIVVDADDISTYFTPLAITLNIDSFEHLEFETRPDQLLVYALVQGDERVIVEFAPIGPTSEDRRRSRRASSPSTRATSSRWSCSAWRPARRSDRRSRRSAAASRRLRRRVHPARTGLPERRRRAQSLPDRRSRSEDDHHDDHQVRQHLQEERRGAAGLERVGEPEDRLEALDVEDEAEDGPEQVRPRTRPGSGSTGRRSPGRPRSSRARYGLVAEPAGRHRERDGRPGQPRQQAAHEDVAVAQPVDADAQRVGGRRVLADGAQVEARAGSG